ncbi:NYN domain-containing protein [Selenomonas ruminantium]|uniref:NYN domain-containing protein n=1 Tax=Selenomonas ruminantium TaxID=971 RepID=UPI00041E9812|nr:NYN domain-containing protein [Selenomonas ruminantium]
MSLSGDLVVFIDAENASPKWGVPLYVWLCQNFKVRECYCVGNRSKTGNEYLRLEGPKFHIVNSMVGKDSADTWLVMLGTRELCLRRSVKKIAILSNDRDFAPLAYLAAERKKKLIIYAAAVSGVEGLKQAIKRIEPGESAAVETIDLDKLVGQQLGRPVESWQEKLLTGARKLIKFPGKLWPRKNKTAALPSANVMEPYLLTLAKGKAVSRNVGKKKKKGHQKQELSLVFSQPDGASERLFRNLSPELHNYLAKRQSQVKLILAPGINGEIIEVPFINGMRDTVFLAFLVAFKVVKKGNLDDVFYRSLGLVCRQNAVYYDSEELDSFAADE